MTNVQFVDRWTAKKLIKSRSLYNTHIISVNDTLSELKEMKYISENNGFDRDSAKFLFFRDIDNADSGFTVRTAEQIIEFADYSVKSNKNILVHCFAGISRSGAIAKFINEHWMLGDLYLENYAGHNHYIYNTLLETAGVETMRSYYTKLENEND